MFFFSKIIVMDKVRQTWNKLIMTNLAGFGKFGKGSGIQPHLGKVGLSLCPGQ